MHIQGDPAVRESQRSVGQWGPVTARCLPHSFSFLLQKQLVIGTTGSALGQMPGEERACNFQLFRPEQRAQL